MGVSEETTGLPDGPGARWVRVALVLVVTVGFPLALVVLVIVNNPELSALDEQAHLDYVRRVEQLEIPRMGEKVLEETVRDAQCRTIRGIRTAPCDLDDHDPGSLAAEGYQYEAQQPPIYYAVTALLRQVARIGPADDFVTTARLTGAAWLSAGLLVFWLACRRLGCPWWPALIVTGLLAVSPGVVYQSATVNNDAAAILTGGMALLMFASLRAQVSLLRVAGWCGVAVLLVLVKPTGVVAVAAAVAALWVDALVEGRLRVRRVFAVTAPLLAGMAVYLAWSLVREARAIVDYDVVLEALLDFKQIERFPLDDVVAAVTRLLDAYMGAGTPIAPPFVAQPAMLVSYALVAAGLMSLWTKRGGDVAQRTGSVSLLTMVLAGPAFAVLFYVDYSVRGGSSPRYGLSLLPLLAVAAASTYRTRRAIAVLLALGVLVLVPLVIASGYPTTRPGHG